MDNNERIQILASDKLRNQVYLFTCDWCNYQINAGTTDTVIKKLIKLILDDNSKVVYAVSTILISDPKIENYKLKEISLPQPDGCLKQTTIFEIDDKTVKEVTESILLNKTSWLLGE